VYIDLAYLYIHYNSYHNYSNYTAIPKEAFASDFIRIVVVRPGKVKKLSIKLIKILTLLVMSS
jgi:hypothetical protein